MQFTIYYQTMKIEIHLILFYSIWITQISMSASIWLLNEKDFLQQPKVEKFTFMPGFSSSGSLDLRALKL